MKKIRLDLERLRVETFETTRADSPARGTVRGNWSQVGTCDGLGYIATCQQGGTCAHTCNRCTLRCL